MKFAVKKSYILAAYLHGKGWSVMKSLLHHKPLSKERLQIMDKSTFPNDVRYSEVPLYVLSESSLSFTSVYTHIRSLKPCLYTGK